MKKITALLISICFAGTIIAQTALTKQQQEVQQTVIKMFDALSNRDSIELKMYCAGDIALYEYGQAWNIDTLINKAIILNTAADFMRTNKFNFINTTVNNDVAWVTYNLSSTFSANGKKGSIDWMETVVLIKEKENWKIKLLHSTQVKRN